MACYPLVALPLREKLAAQIKDLPALLTHDFLDITAVMPPERLRWSRLLKRPVMHPAEQGESTIDTHLHRGGAALRGGAGGRPVCLSQ